MVTPSPSNGWVRRYGRDGTAMCGHGSHPQYGVQPGGGDAVRRPGGLVRWRQGAPVGRFLCATLLVAALAGCSGDDDPPVRPDDPDEAVDLTTADLWLSFDDGTVGADGLTEFPDSNGKSYLG